LGYALAGFKVTGACEIDGEMADLYEQNLGHKVWREPIQDFRKRDPLPPEVLDLDILDGSPPCSSFSLIGKRQETWGQERYFREGQAVQILDELFFEFIELTKAAQPRLVIGENVSGLVVGKAKGYAKAILREFAAAGYDCQLFALNSAVMGVPQQRRRVFFIGRRRDLELPPLRLEFNQPPIPAYRAIADCDTTGSKPVPPVVEAIWRENPHLGSGQNSSAAACSERIRGGNGWHRSYRILVPNLPAHTIISSYRLIHWAEPRYISDHEVQRLSSFPEDYDFMESNTNYVCGMSVPPRMMETLAREIRRQSLDQRTEADAA
jgi:DNA (cytosine-5)-methyltransferase 1